jgi:hypothetical protein
VLRRFRAWIVKLWGGHLHEWSEWQDYRTNVYSYPWTPDDHASKICLVQIRRCTICGVAESQEIEL